MRGSHTHPHTPKLRRRHSVGNIRSMVLVSRIHEWGIITSEWWWLWMSDVWKSQSEEKAFCLKICKYGAHVVLSAASGGGWGWVMSCKKDSVWREGILSSNIRSMVLMWHYQKRVVDESCHVWKSQSEEKVFCPVLLKVWYSRGIDSSEWWISRMIYTEYIPFRLKVWREHILSNNIWSMVLTWHRQQRVVVAVDDSCYVWMSCVAYRWVVSRKNEACHV